MKRLADVKPERETERVFSSRKEKLKEKEPSQTRKRNGKRKSFLKPERERVFSSQKEKQKEKEPFFLRSISRSILKAIIERETVPSRQKEKQKEKEPSQAGKRKSLLKPERETERERVFSSQKEKRKEKGSLQARKRNGKENESSQAKEKRKEKERLLSPLSFSYYISAISLSLSPKK